MNRKQYNNIIEHTLQNDCNECQSALETSRAILNNMGVSLPQGDMKHVYDIIRTNDYMGWRACTKEKAQDKANNGIAAIGISESNIIVLSAEDKEQPVTPTASVMTTSQGPLYTLSNLQFFAHDSKTTAYFRNGATIFRDGNCCKVALKGPNSFKVWHCVHRDLIYEAENAISSDFAKGKHNVFVDYNPLHETESDLDIRDYSDEELKLLYQLDPFGVAFYVNLRAECLYQSVAEQVAYKDRIFNVLFGRAPRYFERSLSGAWYQVLNTGNNDYGRVLSEAELLFGRHALWDEYAQAKFLEMLWSVAEIAISLINRIPKWENFFDGHKTINALIKMFRFGCIIYTDSLEAAIQDALMNEVIERTGLDWAATIVSVMGSLNDIADVLNEQVNCYQDIMDYCINETSFEIFVNTRNGECCTLSEIKNAL